jgi:RHS repeat-associated protein
MQNANFNVIGLSDADGTLVERYEYTPYGQRTVYKKAGSNDALTTAPLYHSQRITADGEMKPYGLCDIGHQGLMHDKEFGLIYNRMRYLDPRTGRWPQRDPAGYVDGLNAYLWVRAQPVEALDPGGTWIIRRRGWPQADAITERPDTPSDWDTIEDLADQIGLEAVQFPKWLDRWDPGKIRTTQGEKTLTNLTIASKLCPGEKFKIPNTIFAHWAGELGDFGKWFVMWDLDISQLKSLGFHVDERQYLPEADFKHVWTTHQQHKALHGFLTWAHGNEVKLGLVPRWFPLEGRDTQEGVLWADIQGIVLDYYSLGFVQAYTCHGQDLESMYRALLVAPKGIWWTPAFTHIAPLGLHLTGPTPNELFSGGRQATN